MDELPWLPKSFEEFDVYCFGNILWQLLSSLVPLERPENPCRETEERIGQTPARAFLGAQQAEAGSS